VAEVGAERELVEDGVEGVGLRTSREEGVDRGGFDACF